jgi:hypothetical protein
LCPVIDLVHLGTVPGLAHQLHYSLKEIDVKTQEVIEAVQRLESGLRTVAVIADKAPYH